MRVAAAFLAGLLHELGLSKWRQERLIEREHAVVIILKDGSRRRALRLSTDARYPISVVARAYKRWEAIGIPAPHIYGAGRLDGVDYLLMQYIAAQPFAFDLPMDAQKRTLHDMGVLLARMRQVAHEGFGYLDEHGRGHSLTWHDFVAAYDESAWLRAAGYLSPKEAGTLQTFVADLSDYNNPPVLLHEDFKPKNMFVGPDGAVVAISDPKPIGGDPLWDVAVCLHFIGREQARRGAAYDDPAFAFQRRTLLDAYQTALDRKLTSAEERRLNGYECLVDAHKSRRLLESPRAYDEPNEAERTLALLKYKLS